MVTELGKFLRKIRIDRDELLSNMAKTLGVSSSFLSLVETGKKKPPLHWEQKIIEYYNLQDKHLEEFTECFFEALNADKIDISYFEEADKKLLRSLVKKFDSLDKAAICKLLEEKEETL